MVIDLLGIRCGIAFSGCNHSTFLHVTCWYETTIRTFIFIKMGTLQCVSIFHRSLLQYIIWCSSYYQNLDNECCSVGLLRQ